MRFASWGDCVSCMIEPKANHFASNLATSTVPILFLNGENDMARMGEKALLAKLPGAKLALIPTARHEAVLMSKFQGQRLTTRGM